MSRKYRTRASSVPPRLSDLSIASKAIDALFKKPLFPPFPEGCDTAEQRQAHMRKHGVWMHIDQVRDLMAEAGHGA